MPKANNLKRGDVVSVNEQLYIVKNIDVKSPTARGASTLYKVRYSNLMTKLKLEQTYKSEEMIQDVDLERRSVQFLFKDDGMYTFMDLENYNQYTLGAEDIEEIVQWISDGLEGIMAMLLDGNIIGITPPATVTMEITYTEPGLKGASATARTKPATLTNNVEVQVPEYLSIGEMVKVNTETGKYMSRA